MIWNRGRQKAITAVIAIAHLLLVGAASAGNSTIKLVSMQETGRQLPAENIVYISAENPVLELQLDLFSSRKDTFFPRTAVILIDDQGKKREFSSDRDGRVSIDDLHEGLYAVAAFNAHAHASTVLAVRPRADDVESLSLNEDSMGADFEEDEPPATARLVMAVTIREKLAPIVENDLIESPGVPPEAIDANIVGYRDGMEPFDYQVQLGQGGVLRGKLITVMHTRTLYSAIKGTRVTVTKNGIPVATVRANALGMFQIGGLRPGNHGLIVAGRGGYAAFAFEAIENRGIANDRTSKHQFVSARMSFHGTVLPVAMIPPTMIPDVKEIVQNHLPDIKDLPPPSPRVSQEPQAPAAPLAEIIDGVTMMDVPDGFSCGVNCDGLAYNPLRYPSGVYGGGGGSGGGSGGAGSSVGGGGGFGALAVGAAIAVPLSASNHNFSTPGVPSSEAGFDAGL